VALRRRTAERRRLQRAVDELLTELAAKERSERTRSEFMATASHELRSPLTSIKGFAELLTRGPHAAAIPARQREFVDIIGRSADRLVDLVNELLDVELPQDEWDTVGGLVFNTLGHVPVEGECCRMMDLEFCAEHEVRPEIEVVQPDYINEAYERVLASDVRYRFVIDTASLR